MKLGFTYRGRHSSDFGLIIRTNPNLIPEIDNKVIEIPGRHGAHYTGTEYGTREVQVELGFVSEGLLDHNRILRDISGWLDPLLGPGELRFDIEPDKFYNAILNSADVSRVENVIRMGRGLLTFICYDPFAYSDIVTQNVTNNPVIINEGTLETYPEFEMVVKRPITEASITNLSTYNRQMVNPMIMLGKPATVDDTPFQPEELIMHDTMQSTSGWQMASEVDVGLIRGQMGVIDGEGFYPEDYGENESGFNWQGPSLQRGIGQNLTDFRAEIGIQSRALPKGSGILDVYFRDANGNLIVKVGFGDYWQDRAENYGRMQVGSYENGWKKESFGHSPRVWEDFDGIMRVERIGNRYEFMFAQRSPRSGILIHVRRNGLVYVDNSGEHSAPIASVQVGFRKNTAYPTRILMRVGEIKVYKLNTRTSSTSTSAAYIAGPGDIININHENGELLKNGEIMNNLFDLRSEFFTLAKGYNNIRVEPVDAFDLWVKYRKAYL